MSKMRYACALICLWSGALFAHPHAFVEMQTKVLAEDNRLRGFSMSWRMDEASSAEMLYDLARVGNDPTARQALADEIMQSVVSEHYFSYLYNQAGQKIKYRPTPTNYGLRAEGNKIVYYFDFWLSEPQPLSQDQFRLQTYDASYYVSMYYDQAATDKSAVKNPVDFFQLPPNCRGDVVEPNVSQALSDYAKSLDQSQRDADNSLGAQFAQTVVIQCD